MAKRYLVAPHKIACVTAASLPVFAANAPRQNFEIRTHCTLLFSLVLSYSSFLQFVWKSVTAEAFPLKKLAGVNLKFRKQIFAKKFPRFFLFFAHAVDSTDIIFNVQTFSVGQMFYCGVSHLLVRKSSFAVLFAQNSEEARGYSSTCRSTIFTV